MLLVTFSSLYSFEGSSLSRFNFPHRDKVAHFIFYFVAAVLGSLFFVETKKEKSTLIKYLKILALSLIFFGIIIEVIQGAMTVNRSGDFFDALANSLGVILGIIGIFIQFQGQRGLK